MKIHVAYKYEDLIGQDVDNLIIKMIGIDRSIVFAYANSNDLEMATFEDCEEIEFD